jgi:uncharacterized protein YdaU (DUF1376 family)
MAKLPWMKFFPADYLVDTQPLSPAARGIWMDLICMLWRVTPRGSLSMSPGQWMKHLRCPPGDFVTVCDELTCYAICNIVTVANNEVTISCRRILREQKSQSSNALRQARYRARHEKPSQVTLRNREKSEVRSRSRSRSQKKSEGGNGHTRAVELAIPDDWMPTENHQKLATVRGLDLAIEAAHFKGKAQEKGWRTGNWALKFTNWLFQEIKFREQRRT